MTTNGDLVQDAVVRGLLLQKLSGTDMPPEGDESLAFALTTADEPHFSTLLPKRTTEPRSRAKI